MRFKLVALGLVISVQVAAEGIATDGTIGAAQVLNGTNVLIPQTLGKTAGNNLFHSFSDFNINTGQTVTFTGNDNLQNVISRVTGDNKSVIDGILQSKVGNADFYFINPNGITFNSNASVDVPAAFHVTTADKMDFGKNGGVFYANLSKKSQLSSDSPVALGFLVTSKVNNGLIDFNAAQITLQKAQTMDLVAGNITVENGANVKSETGEIRLVAMQEEGTASLVKTSDGVLPLPEVTPSNSNAGNISIIRSYADTTGDAHGLIDIWGNNILLNESSLNADTYSSADAIGNIIVHANMLEIINNSYISNSQFTKSVDTHKKSALEAGYYWDELHSLNLDLHGTTLVSTIYNQNLNKVQSSITAKSVEVNQSTITSNSPNGINIFTQTLNLLNGGEISSSSGASLDISKTNNLSGIIANGSV